MEKPQMSGLGDKQTSRDVRVMSALPPKADIRQCEPSASGQSGTSAGHASMSEKSPEADIELM
jgi:hypothetical protein